MKKVNYWKKKFIIFFFNFWTLIDYGKDVKLIFIFIWNLSLNDFDK